MNLLAIMSQIHRRLALHEPKLRRREEHPHEPAVMHPEAEPVSVVDPLDAVGREEELAQVLPPPAGGGPPMDGQPVEVDQAEPPAGLGPGPPVEEEVAQIQIFM